MPNEKDFIDTVRRTGKKRILFLPHAVRQMIRPDRMISSAEIHSVIEKGEIIEDYPEDPRGRSCLLLGQGVHKRPIHVVCSPKGEYLAIVTAYLPSIEEWEHNFRRRRKE